MLTIPQMSEIAKKHSLPLIVDAAAEEDLKKYYAQGADLVIYSGAKAIEAPSSAVVLGRDPYIPWIQLQNKGIRRAMKIGKDNIIGFVTALEAYLANGSEDGDSMKRVSRYLSGNLIVSQDYLPRKSKIQQDVIFIEPVLKWRQRKHQLCKSLQI